MSNPTTRCRKCGVALGASPCPGCGPIAVAAPKKVALFGLVDLPRGALFTLRHPGLWPYIAIPFLANIGLWIWLYLLAKESFVEHVRPWLRERLGDSGFWIGMSEGSAVVAFALLAMMLFGTFASILGAPFYDFLSEATEKRVLGRPLPSDGMKGIVGRTFRSTFAAIKAAAWIFMWYLLWLPLLLIPLVGSIFYFLEMARLRTMEVLVAAFARKEYSISEMRAFMRANYWRSFGLGGVLNFMIAVPIVGWLAYPLAIVGGTIFFLEGEK